jgi:hypothetical protein
MSENGLAAGFSSDEFDLVFRADAYRKIAVTLLARDIANRGAAAVAEFRSRELDAVSQYDMGSKLNSEELEAAKSKALFKIAVEAVETVIADAEKKAGIA